MPESFRVTALIIFSTTHKYVVDLLVQSFFPGPTWIAASNFRGTKEPACTFVAFRHEMIMGMLETWDDQECSVFITMCSFADYFRFVWDTYCDSHRMKEDARFDVTLNLKGNEKKHINRRVSLMMLYPVLC